MGKFVDECMEALERLKANKPIVLPKGSKINLDIVALEAGKGRSSIRKDRYPEPYALVMQAEKEYIFPKQADSVKIKQITKELEKKYESKSFVPSNNF